MAGVPINNPASVTAWAAATSPDSHGGAIWGVGGIASDVWVVAPAATSTYTVTMEIPVLLSTPVATR
jgi:hypothetical protein